MPTQTKQFCYWHPHPAVTTDIVIFTIREEKLQLLLIRRRNPPFQGGWALPGGFLDMNEDLADCAKRELEEETGIKNVYLEQLYTFGKHDRDPRERIGVVAGPELVGSRQDSRVDAPAAARAALDRKAREAPPQAVH